MPSPRTQPADNDKLPFVATLLPLARNAASTPPNSRKRGRDCANGDASTQNDVMVADAEEDYIDVDMASADAYEEDTASTQVAANMQNVNDAASRTGVFVPFYPHLGGSDFDDDDLE